MSKICLIALVALVAVGNLALAEKVYDIEDDLDEKLAETTSAYGPHYLLMNSELVEATKSTDPKENFALIKEITAEGARWFDSSFRSEAVNLFTSLPSSLKHSCTYKSYQLLTMNYLATRGRSHEDDGLRRVESIVRQYAKAHAVICRPKYAESFKKLKETIGEKVFEHVNELFKDLPESDLVKFANKEYPTEVDVLTSGLVELNINVPNVVKILEALERLVEDEAEKKLLYAATNELDGGYKVADEFNKSIYEKHVKEPCHKYLAKSKSLFAPARFDALIEDEAQKDLLHPSDQSFRQAWVNHRLCQYMIGVIPYDHLRNAILSRGPAAAAE